MGELVYKLLENDTYKKYFREKDITIDYLYHLYDYYLENLKNIININGFTFDFKTPSQIKINDVSRIRISNKIAYLSNNSIKDFGNEIEKYGIYFPFILFDMYLKEGVHRVTALKRINSITPRLCWNIDRVYIKRKLENPINLNMLLPSKYINYIIKNNAFNNVEYIEDDVYKIEIDNYDDLYTIMVFYVTYLSEMLIKFRNEFVPSNIMNDESCFKEWINCNKEEL